MSELLVTVAGRESVVVGLVSALCAGGGLAYAVWDDSGYGVRPMVITAWVGVGIGALVAGARGGWWQWFRDRRAQASNEASTAQLVSETTAAPTDPSARRKA